MSVITVIKSIAKRLFLLNLKPRGVFYLNSTEHLPPPLSAEEEQKIIDKIDVLPQPDGPIIETNSPSLIEKLRPLIAVISSSGI